MILVIPKLVHPWTHKSWRAKNLYSGNLKITLEICRNEIF